MEGGSEGKRKNLLPAHSVNYIILSCDFGQRVAVFLLFFFCFIPTNSLINHNWGEKVPRTPNVKELLF